MGVEIAIATAAAISSITGTAISVAAVSSALNIGIALAASAAINYGVAALSRQKGSSAGGQSVASINAPEVKGNVRQAMPTQRIVYGTVRTGGAIYFIRVIPPYLYIGFVYSSRRITGIRAVNIGDQRVTFSNPTFGTIMSPPQIDGMPAYHSRLECCFQNGSLSQPTNPLLRRDFPALDTDFRLPGTANAVFRCHYGSSYDEFQQLWGNVQIPNIEVELDGAPLYDPRNPSHVLPASDSVADFEVAEATWTFSNNAALVQADYCWQAYGLNAWHDRINWDQVAVTANRDDEVVQSLAGPEKRYTADGVVLMSDKPAAVMEGMLTANRGFLRIKNGLLEVPSSAPQSPIKTIVDDMWIGAIEYRAFKAKRDLANKVTTRFVATDRNYQDADGPILIDSELVSEDGEILPVTLRLPFTTGAARTQRLARAYLQTARQEKSVSGTVDLRLLGIEEGDIVRIWSEVETEMNGLYSVEQWALSDGFNAISLSLVAYNGTIENDWIASRDEQPFTLSDVAA